MPNTSGRISTHINAYHFRKQNTGAKLLEGKKNGIQPVSSNVRQTHTQINKIISSKL